MGRVGILLELRFNGQNLKNIIEKLVYLLAYHLQLGELALLTISSPVLGLSFQPAITLLQRLNSASLQFPQSGTHGGMRGSVASDNILRLPIGHLGNMRCDPGYILDPAQMNVIRRGSNSNNSDGSIEVAENFSTAIRMLIYSPR